MNPSGPRNPWGSPPPNNGGRGGGNLPPDLDALFGQANRHLRGIMPEGGRNWAGPAAIVILLLWVASGVYFITPGENAVIQRFGAWTRTQTDPGLGFHLPWPVEKHNIINTQSDRRLTIGFEGARQTNLQSESLMLTEDANIVDINVVVLWNISSAESYLFNVVDPDATIKQVAQSALREAVGQAPLQQIITEGRNDVALQMQETMQEILDRYKAGMSIKQVLIQEATVHPDVLEAFDDVVAARQDAERFQNEATIYRNDIIPAARGEAIKQTEQAEGYKKAQISKAEGDAARFNQVFEAYQSGKDVTRERIYIETMEEVLKNAKTVVLDGKGASAAVPVLPLGYPPQPAPALPSTAKEAAQ